jgi:hypothetical protein
VSCMFFKGTAYFQSIWFLYRQWRCVVLSPQNKIIFLHTISDAAAIKQLLESQTAEDTWYFDILFT